MLRTYSARGNAEIKDTHRLSRASLTQFYQLVSCHCLHDLRGGNASDDDEDEEDEDNDYKGAEDDNDVNDEDGIADGEDDNYNVDAMMTMMLIMIIMMIGMFERQ